MKRGSKISEQKGPKCNKQREFMQKLDKGLFED
jgi:hypothetical protein